LQHDKIDNVNIVEFNDFQGVDLNNLPNQIQSQIRELSKLEGKVRSAIYSAEEAEAEVKKASGMEAGFFQKKAAIEGLQSAGKMLAKAVQAGTEAQKISFEFQKKLSETTKYLLLLGAGNIAANRAIVRALELRLKGASEKEISHLARQELFLVIKQLKAQEDIHKRQVDILNALKEHDKWIRDLKDKVEQNSQTLTHYETVHSAHEIKIDNQGAALSRVLIQQTQLQKKIEEQQQMIATLTAALDQRNARESELYSTIDRANLSVLELKSNLDSMTTSVDSNLKRGNMVSTALALFSIAGLFFVYFTK